MKFTSALFLSFAAFVSAAPIISPAAVAVGADVSAGATVSISDVTTPVLNILHNLETKTAAVVAGLDASVKVDAVIAVNQLVVLQSVLATATNNLNVISATALKDVTKISAEASLALKTSLTNIQTVLAVVKAKGLADVKTVKTELVIVNAKLNAFIAALPSGLVQLVNALLATVQSVLKTLGLSGLLSSLGLSLNGSAFLGLHL